MHKLKRMLTARIIFILQGPEVTEMCHYVDVTLVWYNDQRRKDVHDYCS